MNNHWIKKYRSPNLNEREISSQSDAEDIMKAAIKNLKNKKKISIQLVEAFKKDWESVSLYAKTTSL